MNIEIIMQFAETTNLYYTLVKSRVCVVFSRQATKQYV